MYGIVLIAALIVTGGAIAVIGDRVGSRVGKKKLSLFGLRPRHTSVIVTIVTGVLIIDHVMNGELMWSYPFFTAATSPEGVSEMVREMSTVGVAMSAFITSVWAVMIIARKYKAQSLAKAETHSNH